MRLIVFLMIATTTWDCVGSYVLPLMELDKSLEPVILYICTGICVVSSALVLMKPVAFVANCQKKQVVSAMIAYPISALEITEKIAFIGHRRIDLSHLSDEEMVHVREQIPDNIIQPDDISPEVIYVNLLIVRAVERKETIEINRFNLVNIPEEDIDAASISFDKIVSRCKELVSEGSNLLHVVCHKGKPQEANVQFVIAKDAIQISVST